MLYQCSTIVYVTVFRHIRFLLLDSYCHRFSFIDCTYSGSHLGTQCVIFMPKLCYTYLMSTIVWSILYTLKTILILSMLGFNYIIHWQDSQTPTVDFRSVVGSKKVSISEVRHRIWSFLLMVDLSFSRYESTSQLKILKCVLLAWYI